jgi:cathepsin L
MLFVLFSLCHSLYFHQHEEKAFVLFMREHNLVYTGQEYFFRFGIFMANTRLVEEFNVRENSFALGMTSLACMTANEVKAMKAGPSLTGLGQGQTEQSMHVGDVPDAWDWRTKNVVGPVKDQGQVGGLALLAVDAEASSWAIKTGKYTSLSYKTLAWCLTAQTVQEYYKWVIANRHGKFPTEDASACVQWTGVGNLVSFIDKKSGNEDELKSLVYNSGPAAIGFDASHFSFQLYHSGIYMEPSCGTNPDHDMLCVGYGTEDTTAYWILKNSWGVSWGEKGYMRSARNRENMCGVASFLVIPVNE